MGLKNVDKIVCDYESNNKHQEKIWICSPQLAVTINILIVHYNAHIKTISIDKTYTY